MSETKTRRTIALSDGAKEDLDLIKDKTGASTDIAAISDAINFRAKLVDRRPDEVLIALSIYDQLRSEKNTGHVIFTERPGEPQSKQRFFIPTVG